MINTWVKEISTGGHVLVTGVSGDQIRVFRGGRDMRYDWLHVNDVKPITTSDQEGEGGHE